MALLLLATIFLPLAGAVLVWPAAALGRGTVRWAALLVALATLVLAGIVIGGFLQEAAAPTAFAETTVPWLTASGFDIRLAVALDGLSLWLFGLSALLMFTSVLVSWKAIDQHVTLYYSMLLLLLCGCLGVFTARDIILFYVFFEFTLIPLFFLIGVWGSEQRRYAAIKFFLFTLTGSLLTFLGLLTIVLWAGGRIGVAGAWARESLRPPLTFSISQITSRLNEQYGQLDASVDRDASQSISAQEVLDLPDGQRPRAERMFKRVMFPQLDRNRDQLVSRGELIQDRTDEGRQRLDEIYKSAFALRHDLNKDGKLSQEEITQREGGTQANSRWTLEPGDLATMTADDLDKKTSWQLSPADFERVSLEQIAADDTWNASFADARPLDFPLQMWVFLALFIGFAIKVPLFPLHTWLPLAHVQAPTAGSVFLAGILLKIGTYGFLRFSVPMLPEATAACVPWLLWLSVAGILYGALVALAQSDMKKLIAYSSVSHLGYCMLGLFALNALGTQGSVLQMINHGISTGALFALVGMLYERYHTREIKQLSGIARRLPWLAFFMVLFTFSSIGVPGLNGFVGEFLILLGMFQRAWQNVPFAEITALKVISVLAVLGVVLGAWYMLWLVQRVFFGPLREPHHHDHTALAAHSEQDPIRDLSLREIFALAPLAVFVFWIGLWPAFFLKPLAAPVATAIAAARSDLPETRLTAPQREARAPEHGAESARRAAVLHALPDGARLLSPAAPMASIRLLGPKGRDTTAQGADAQRRSPGSASIRASRPEGPSLFGGFPSRVSPLQGYEAHARGNPGLRRKRLRPGLTDHGLSGLKRIAIRHTGLNRRGRVVRQTFVSARQAAKSALRAGEIAHE
jgi:NADH:ubiquinone oxidoreductase subunit 4 (subunit M)